jgi:hypothetical protein
MPDIAQQLAITGQIYLKINMDINVQWCTLSKSLDYIVKDMFQFESKLMKTT